MRAGSDGTGHNGEVTAGLSPMRSAMADIALIAVVPSAVGLAAGLLAEARGGRVPLVASYAASSRWLTPPRPAPGFLTQFALVLYADGTPLDLGLARALRVLAEHRHNGTAALGWWTEVSVEMARAVANDLVHQGLAERVLRLDVVGREVTDATSE